MGDIVDRLREPDRHDPKCPFKTHCYCDDGAPHDIVQHPYAIEAADEINALREQVSRAQEIFEQIGIIASGCATTHGDPGGGLEMISGYAGDGFAILAQQRGEDATTDEKR